jgi:hypothetical protein
MRRDMSRLVLDRPRAYNSCYTHQDGRDVLIKGEDAPPSAPMRLAYDSGFVDHLKPLVCFLQKRVGQPWNKVWSEICAAADARSLRGWHLRDHVCQLVELNWYTRHDDGDEEAVWHGYTKWGRAFYVTSDGVLRRTA